MGTAVDRADALDDFSGGQEARGFEPLTLAMQPFGFNRVEPGTLGRQVADDQADAVTRLLDRAVVLAHPGAHDLAVVPGGVIPDQQHRLLAALLGARRAPEQEVDRDGADGTPLDEAQDRKSTRLNSSHSQISYAVFCLKKKNTFD